MFGVHRTVKFQCFRKHQEGLTKWCLESGSCPACWAWGRTERCARGQTHCPDSLTCQCLPRAGSLSRAVLSAGQGTVQCGPGCAAAPKAWTRGPAPDPELGGDGCFGVTRIL